MNRRLYRSPTDRILAGVAGGMAESWNLDPALVRIGWALLVLATGGVFLLVYVVAALVVPLRPSWPNGWPTHAAGDPLAPDGPAQASGFTQASGPTQPGGGPTPPGGPTQGAPYVPDRQRSDATGPVIVGLILVAVGGFFLLRQFIPLINLGLIWPVVAIAIGAVLILAAFLRRGP